MLLLLLYKAFAVMAGSVHSVIVLMLGAVSVSFASSSLRARLIVPSSGIGLSLRGYWGSLKRAFGCCKWEQYRTHSSVIFKVGASPRNLCYENIILFGRSQL